MAVVVPNGFGTGEFEEYRDANGVLLAAVLLCCCIMLVDATNGACAEFEGGRVFVFMTFDDIPNAIEWLIGGCCCGVFPNAKGFGAAIEEDEDDAVGNVVVGCCTEVEKANGGGWVAVDVDVIIEVDIEKVGAVAAVEELPKGVYCGGCMVLCGVFTDTIDDMFVDDAKGVCGCVPNGKLFL